MAIPGKKDRQFAEVDAVPLLECGLTPLVLLDVVPRDSADMALTLSSCG